MRLVEHDQVEESWIEFLKAQAQGLLGGDEKALLRIDFPGVDAVARFVGQVRLEAIGKRLVNKGIAVREKQHVLSLIRAEEQVEQRHRGARLASSRSHYQQRAALVGCECLGNTADGFVLVGPIYDLCIYRHTRQRLAILTQEQQALQVLGREKTGDDARIGLPDFPEPGLVAVGHETERCIRLVLCDFSYVVAELLVGLARVARAALRLDDGNDFAVGRIKAIVGDAVPRLRVVAIDGNLQTDLRPVIEIPPGVAQRRVNDDVPSLGFV